VEAAIFSIINSAKSASLRALTAPPTSTASNARIISHYLKTCVIHAHLLALNATQLHASNAKTIIMYPMAFACFAPAAAIPAIISTNAAHAPMHNTSLYQENA
jgi:hypothetical protein